MRRIRKVFEKEFNELTKEAKIPIKTQEEIMSHIYSKDHGITWNGEAKICPEMSCNECMFNEKDCITSVYDWLMEEI